MADFTKRAIKESLIKLLNEMPLNSISVKKIVEDCGINRNSFYYHYEDIPELIEEIIHDNLDYVINRYPSIQSFNECVEVTMGIIEKNKKVIYNIYNSLNRSVFEDYLMKICDYTVSSYLNTAYNNNCLSKENKQIIYTFLKCELFGLTISWLQTGMKDEIKAITKKVVLLCHHFMEELLNK